MKVYKNIFTGEDILTESKITLGKLGDVDIDKMYDEEIKKFLKKYKEFDNVKWHGVVGGKSMNDVIKKSIINDVEKAKGKLEQHKDMKPSQIEKEVRNFLSLVIKSTALQMAKK